VLSRCDRVHFLQDGAFVESLHPPEAEEGSRTRRYLAGAPVRERATPLALIGRLDWCIR